MKLFAKAIPVVTATLLALTATGVMAEDMPQEDGAEALADTVSEQVVSYRCSSGKRLTVNYGFNAQGLPTFAESNLNGKTRNMPINLYRSDSAGMVFGDDNNFSIVANDINSRNVKRSTIMVSDPASEIIYNNCRAK
ncbi:MULTISPECIES: DUF7606 domain-containing protein [unclassified Moraxella]|uniref:ACP-like domain-containing protein n=1 Tax=unclassified Moraxella TaxID=2685852 RepID=UPI003AF444F6